MVNVLILTNLDPNKNCKKLYVAQLIIMKEFIY